MPPNATLSEKSIATEKRPGTVAIESVYPHLLGDLRQVMAKFGEKMTL